MGGTEKLTALTEPQWMEDIFELCEAWPGVIKVIINVFGARKINVILFIFKVS